MIILFIDALIAAVKTIDRGLTALENVRLRAHPPQPVETREPTGTGSTVAASAGPGGHPEHEATSSLLLRAAWLLELDRDFPHEPNITTALRDRAAQFAAAND